MLDIQKYLIAAIIGVLYSALMIFGGWKAHVWYTGYETAKLDKIEKVVNTQNTELVAGIATQFEEQKQVLQAASDDITAKMKNVTINKIYTNQCLDQNGVDLLKELKDKGNATRGVSTNETK